MHKVRMQHMANDPVRILIEEFNKLRNACAAEGIDVADVQVIADQNGRNADGSAAVETAVAA